MSLATPVKEAPVTSEPVVAKTPDQPSGTAIENLTTYEQKGGKPYIVKLENADAVWDKLDHDTQSNAELISEYFREESDKGTYRLDGVAYKDFIKHYEKITNTQGAPFAVKVKKISEFIRYIKRTA